MIAASFVLALGSKYLIEDVFRDKGRKPLRPALAYAFCLTLLVLTTSAGATLWLHENEVIQEIQAKEEALHALPADYPGAAALDPEKPVKSPVGLPIRPDARTAAWDMDKKHLKCMGVT